MSKLKELFPVTTYPDPLASDEEKMTEEYGIAMGQYILYKWYYVQEQGPASGHTSNCRFYEKRDKYHNLKLYARGEQDTKIYKKLLDGDDTTYTNYDWRPIQILPKFVKLVVNQMSERLFDIKAEATDKFSTDLKDAYRKNLEDIVISKPIRDIAAQTLGIDMNSGIDQNVPETQEEIDLFMKTKYKPGLEIASEEAIKYTLDLNDYEDIQSEIIEDIVTYGVGAIKHETHSVEGITLRRVDPSDMIYSYPEKKNFKKVHYFGEVRKMTINDIRRITNDKFTKDELKSIATATTNWSNYQGNTQGQYHYREEDMENLIVDVLEFTFKTSKTITYKKKYFKNNGYRLTRKESTFQKNEMDTRTDNFDVIKKTIDVWYEGSLIIGTNKIFDYRLCENMIRPEGYLNRTIPNYLVYAPRIYQNRTKSLVEDSIQYIDLLQQIHIKMQQFVAKARPNGIIIDVSGFEEIAFGDGNVLDIKEMYKIFNQTGDVIKSSVTDEGIYRPGNDPIRPIDSNLSGLAELQNQYLHTLNQMRDAIGIPPGADATLPHPDTLVGIQKQVALNSNTATRHILQAALNISERLGEALALRIKDIFKYSHLKQTYINAIGRINTEILKDLNTYHLHDLGVHIMLKPDLEEKQLLENNINSALQQQIITLDDAIDIRNIPNIKLANELLKIRRIKREKQQQQQAQELERIRGQAQIEATERAAQSRQVEIQTQLEADLALERAKTENNIQVIQAEEQSKTRLMEREFFYNERLKQIEVNGQTIREQMKEDRGIKLLDRQSTQTSKIQEQKDFSRPAQDFETDTDIELL